MKNNKVIILNVRNYEFTMLNLRVMLLKVNSLSIEVIT
jgi:hypothetical protein